MSLERRVAVITGATGFTGALAAHALAAAGTSLVLVGTHPRKLDALTQELNLPPERILTLVADLSDAPAVFAAAQSVLARFGRVDILLHLVGGWTGGKTLVETPVTDVESMLRQHLWTTFFLIQAFLPHLSENGWGRIIAVSSPTAVKPLAKSGAYAIGKAAQETLLLTVAREAAARGVTVHIIEVRSIDVKGEGKGTAPEEIVTAVLDLCSDEAGANNSERLDLFSKPA